MDLPTNKINLNSLNLLKHGPQVMVPSTMTILGVLFIRSSLLLDQVLKLLSKS